MNNKDQGGESRRDRHLRELLRIMKHMFFSIVRVNLLTDTAYVLQSQEAPERVGTECSWKEYLNSHGRLMSKEVMEILSAYNLMEQYLSGKMSLSEDLPYRKKGEFQEWLTMSVYLKKEEGTVYATVITRNTTREHMQKRIIDYGMYRKTDFFVCVDVKNNSYIALEKTVNPTTDRPPKQGDNYSIDIIHYAKSYVVPEDRMRFIHEMGLKTILERLREKELHSFSYGIKDQVRGYRRKLMEYQYYDEASHMILLSRTDITDMYMKEQEKQQELLAALERASTDSLTGLLNHQGTIDEVSFYLGEENSKSIMMFIDMDDFKSVNDTLGHIVGDKLLCSVAEILREELAPNDLAGRVGGDEFMVFLRSVQDKEEAKVRAENICRKIARLSVEFEFPVSCSIGIAIAPDDGKDYATLTEHADRRVYCAKANGKNQIFSD